MNLRQRARALYDLSELPYHNWKHVEACLAEFETVRQLCEHEPLVEIAIWYHDAIYDPRRNDNEQASATAAWSAMATAGYPRDQREIVEQLILDTRHTRPPTTHDGRLVADIDLAIFGQPPDVFDAYDAAIRREYAHVRDADFVRGRAAVLRQFLGRPSLYHTPAFRQRYEAPARGNLLRWLEAHGT